jgi:hypothetical protein
MDSGDPIEGEVLPTKAKSLPEKYAGITSKALVQDNIPVREQGLARTRRGWRAPTGEDEQAKKLRVLMKRTFVPRCEKLEIIETFNSSRTEVRVCNPEQDEEPCWGCKIRALTGQAPEWTESG